MKATFTMDVLYNMDAIDAWIGHGCLTTILQLFVYFYRTHLFFKSIFITLVSWGVWHGLVVSTEACHSKGRGIESRRRQFSTSVS